MKDIVKTRAPLRQYENNINLPVANKKQDMSDHPYQIPLQSPAEARPCQRPGAFKQSKHDFPEALYPSFPCLIHNQIKFPG